MDMLCHHWSLVDSTKFFEEGNVVAGVERLTRL